MTDQTTRDSGEPRLGAALIFGGDAAICVHVHTGPAGIAAIWDRLYRAHDAVPADTIADSVPVVAVTGDLGVVGGAAYMTRFDVLASDMEDVIALAKGLNQ